MALASLLNCHDHDYGCPCNWFKYESWDIQQGNEIPDMFFFSSHTPSPVNADYRPFPQDIFGLSSTLYHFCHPSWCHYLLTFKFDPHKNMPALQAMFVDLAVFVHTGVIIWVIRTLYQCTNLVKKIFFLGKLASNSARGWLFLFNGLWARLLSFKLSLRFIGS